MCDHYILQVIALTAWDMGSHIPVKECSHILSLWVLGIAKAQKTMNALFYSNSVDPPPDINLENLLTRQEDLNSFTSLLTLLSMTLLLA